MRNVSLVVPYYVQPEREAASWLSTLLGAATAIPRRRFATLLDGVEFSARQGDRVALVGRNGAGKSTMLRVLAGAFEPTTGSVKLEGSHQALLSMALGFNSEATVMENIFLRATAMQISARHVREIVEPVLEFSGLGAVANRRLLTLSSGQRMRLGFAISTVIQHDIMLLDEWFGAGDVQFIRRARKRLMDRVDGAGIVVVASHNDTLLRKLCNRALLMDGGKVLMDADVPSVLARYRELYPAPASKRAKKSRKETTKKIASNSAGQKRVGPTKAQAKTTGSRQASPAGDNKPVA